MSVPRRLVIYHGGCRDGFGAAWAANVAFKGDADFFAGYYGQDPPDLVDGRDVYIVDFTYPRETLKKIVALATSLTIFDHHQTNQKDLEGFADEVAALGAPRPNVVFDMGRSGAGITWDELMANYVGTCAECGAGGGHQSGCPSKRPWAIDYIEDRDLWRFAHPDSRVINAYLGSIPFTFEAWDDTRQMPLDDARFAGLSIQLKIQQYVHEVGKNAIFFTLPVRLGTSDERWYRDVPLINAPQCDISELLEHLMDHLGTDFVMGWWQRHDRLFQYSLRSRGDLDVSTIAKAFGGGGHKNAAGFQTSVLIHYSPVGSVLDINRS